MEEFILKMRSGTSSVMKYAGLFSMVIDLLGQGEGHFTPVPSHAPSIVLVIVKEVNFLRGLDHCRVQIEHLQQRSGASLADSDDDSLRQLLDQVVQVDLLFRSIALAQFMEQAALELQGAEGDLLRPRDLQSALYNTSSKLPGP